MTDQRRQTGGGRNIFGDFAPKLAFHLGRAVGNGVSQAELIETITHVTLYAGWPNGMAAMGVAKAHFTDKNGKTP